jgi:hypothetical protein
MKTRLTAAVAALALVALTGCAGAAAVTPESAYADCMEQAAQDAAEATGEPVENFTDDPGFAPACDLYVHIFVTMPLELDSEPDPEGVADTIACIGSVAEAAYKKDSHDWGSPYSDGMTYPEMFQKAVGSSGC